MPKNRKIIKTDNRIIKTKVPSKHSIGGRKSGKSANLMTNNDLLDVFTDKNKTKYHAKAKNVLKRRKVTV